MPLDSCDTQVCTDTVQWIQAPKAGTYDSEHVYWTRQSDYRNARLTMPSLIHRMGGEEGMVVGAQKHRSESLEQSARVGFTLLMV